MLTAKEYLSRVAVMQRCINQKCAELEALENTIYNASGIDNSREKVQTSVQNKGFDKVDRKIDLQNEISMQITALVLLKHKVIDEIQALDRELFIDVLFERSIENRTLEEIAVKRKYSYSHIKHIHGYALEAFRKKYADILFAG